MNRLRVLVVSPWFPYPARSGSKQRVYQLVRQLAVHHDVTLLSYVRVGEEPDVAGLRREVPVEFVRERPRRVPKRVSQAVSAFSRRPFSSRTIHSRAMQRAIDTICSRNTFDVIQLESSLLCAFDFPLDIPLVLDEHNIEYEVFQRMGDSERSLPRRVFHRVEEYRFRRFEQRAWERVAACALTSEREEEIVRRLSPSTPTAVVPNGVDLGFFALDGVRPEPTTIMFNGLLAYRPNLDAAHYLVEEIWPLIERDTPSARLLIVGRGSQGDLRRLQRANVTLTGEVPDVRPYLRQATAVVVPIRMGGGTRLKIVEALAMGKPVVSTAVGCEGLNVRDGEHLVIADKPAEFALAVARLLADPATAGALGRAGRALVESEYSWRVAGERLAELYGRL